MLAMTQRASGSEERFRSYARRIRKQYSGHGKEECNWEEAVAGGIEKGGNDNKMEQYTVTGMSCAACSSRVEKAVSGVPGVTACSVSLLTNSMGVEGTASSADIIKAVQDAGYGASVKGAGKEGSVQAQSLDAEEALKDHETPVLKRRLWYSVGFLIVLMYFSMGHMMWGWPLPAFFDGNHVAMGLIQLILTAIVMVINQKFFISGFKSLWHKAPNMDTLVALGSMAAFTYSTYALFAMTDAQVKGNADAVMSYMHEFYFESAAMILTLITVGKMLEARSKGKTTDALKSLMKLAPKTAVVVRDGEEVTVGIEQVKKGDVFVVRPGENIPVDGIVLELSLIHIFRLCEQHVILKYRVGVGLYIFGVAPTGRAVFDTFPVFLRILAFYIDNQPDKDSPYNTDKQIHRCKARKRVCKGSGKAVCKGKHLAGQVSPRREPHRLSDFVKEIDKEQIGGI